MAVTAIADVFVPEVIGAIVTDILFERTPLLALGSVSNATEQVFGDGGNTVTFPYFDSARGIVQDNPGATRSGVTPSKISMGSYQETMNSKIISLDADKNALADALRAANPMAHISELVARESQLAIQGDLVDKAMQTPLQLNVLGESTKTLTVDYILEAKMKRGEYAAFGRPVLYAATKAVTDLKKSTDWKTLATASTTSIATNGTNYRGADGGWQCAPRWTLLRWIRCGISLTFRRFRGSCRRRARQRSPMRRRMA